MSGLLRKMTWVVLPAVMTLLGAVCGAAEEAEEAPLLDRVMDRLDWGEHRRVTLYVVDAFYSETSHGELVSRLARRQSLGRVNIRHKHVGLMITEQTYLRALEEVLAEVKRDQFDAAVLNLSLGSDSPSDAERRLIKALQAAGVLIVAAAGNEGAPTPWYPATYDGVVAVAWLHNHTRAEKSNYGKHICVGASGMGLKEFDRIEPSSEPYVAERVYYRIHAGTSFAAPRVAGLLAYLLQQRPDLTQEELLAELQAGCRPLPHDATFREGCLGSGAINASKLLRKLDPVMRRARMIRWAAVGLSVLVVLVGFGLMSLEDDAGYGLLALEVLVLLLVLTAYYVLVEYVGVLEAELLAAGLLVAFSVSVAAKYCWDIWHPPISEEEEGTEQEDTSQPQPNPQPVAHSTTTQQRSLKDVFNALDEQLELEQLRVKARNVGVPEAVVAALGRQSTRQQIVMLRVLIEQWSKRSDV